MAPKRAPLTAYTDSLHVNTAFAIAFDEQPELFTWAGSRERLGFTIGLEVKVMEPPRAQLGPIPDTTRNVALFFDSLQVVLRIKRGKLSLGTTTVKLKMSAAAFLGTVGDQIVLRDFDFDVDPIDLGKRGNLFKRLEDEVLDEVLDYVSNRFIPERSATLARSLPLPQLHKLYGRDVDARLLSAEVCEVNGEYLMCVAAGIGEGGGTAPTPLPPTFHPAGTAVALVSQWAVNQVLDDHFEGDVYKFKRSISLFFAGIGVKGKIRTDRLHVKLRRRNTRSTARVKALRLEAGAEFFGQWLWLGAPAPTLDVAATVALATDEDEEIGYLMLDALDEVRFTFDDDGGFFALPLALFENLLDEALERLDSRLDRRLSGFTVELYRLPDTLPGTTIPAQLNFASGGFRFERKAVMAAITLAPREKPEETS